MNVTDLSLGHEPLTAKELTNRATEFGWNPLVGFKYWARAAETIHHEAQVYLREGNLPQTYLLLYRYSTLVLHYLSKHPQAKELESRRAIQQLGKRLPRVIETLEILRPEIDDNYDRWRKISAAERDLAQDRKQLTSGSSTSYAKHAARDPALSWSYSSPADVLDVQDYQDLAVDLARKEIRNRRRITAGESERDSSRIGRWGTLRTEQERKPAPEPYMDDDELRRQMEATRRQLDRSDDYARPYDDDRDYAPPSSYYYPSINKSARRDYDYERPVSRERLDGPRPQPPRPPKERDDWSPPPGPPPWPDKGFHQERDSSLFPPPRPGKELLAPSTASEYNTPDEEAPIVPAKTPAESSAESDRRVTFRPAAYLENGDPVRPVFLPSTLRERFLQLAAPNTRRGLEMCGTLCGTAVNNALFISHLVIPEQTCTSDTCETENESSMLEYCITNDLQVIGWIHTHPTQTCFMSSRDLHTQAGYQVMMPESIAIVCAPKSEPSWGIFRLTNPPGLPHLLSCQRSETFHPHSVDNLYVDAGHPQGHVYESRSLEFEVCDLRPGH
ncbi:uncharacterized protein C8A04DRAFT_28815 [Dichotomopilus funicola]|uniref:MPN domain-containing protein n=1 Tax=Dichotomopilus funicola TaxID=1934379 RepID=A0AAN6ZLZ5_9PEZI|nr:hypothetical protein C8A04DRAFT_28815 [Dichotomopilus funicola]